jgi:hypothetical protein
VTVVRKRRRHRIAFVTALVALACIAVACGLDFVGENATPRTPPEVPEERRCRLNRMPSWATSSRSTQAIRACVGEPTNMDRANEHGQLGRELGTSIPSRIQSRPGPVVF